MAVASSLSKSMTASISSMSLTDTPEFVLPISSKYHCEKCKAILRPPVKQTACGHRICANCIQELQANDDEPLCPAQDEDCVVLTSDNIYPDRGTDRELFNLLVYCSNRPRCDSQVKWRNLNDHIAKECQFNEISCPNAQFGCEARFILSEKRNHLDNECQFVPFICPYCQVNFPRVKIEEHSEKCQLEPAMCFYSAEGCSFRGTRKDVYEHAQKEITSHLELTTTKCRKQDKHITALEEKVALTSREKKTLESNLDALKNEFSTDIQQTKAEIAALKQGMERRTPGGDEVRSASIQSRAENEKARDIDLRLALLEGRVTSDTTVVDSRQVKASVSEDESKIIRSNERMVALHDVTLAEYEIRFRCLETANYNGILLWKITSFDHRKKAAVDGRTLSVYSQPFYTDPYGYKMCARIYLDGDGMGKGTHASLYFVVMKGEYDSLLQWPFRHRVTMILLDQENGRKHIRDTFRPDPTSTSFRRPTNAMNVASGSPLFVSQSTLESSKYLRDDTIYIMVKIDLSDGTPITSV